MNKKYQKADQLAFRKLGEITAVIELRGSRNFHELNEVAGRIWDLCDGEHDGEAIARQIAEEFEVNEAVARQDTQEFLSLLTEKNLVRANA